MSANKLQQTEKSPEELRSFGLVMSLILTLILGVSVYRRGTVVPMHVFVLAFIAYFLIGAILAPRSLRSVEHYWMAFGERLSVVMTFVIMSLTFFLMVTPIGCLMRLLGRDPLKKSFDRSAKSYWEPADAGTASRHFLPY